MPGFANLADEATAEATAYFSVRFGVQRSFFARFTFEEKDGEIWATTAPFLCGVHSSRPPGLCILQRIRGLLTPTSLFLRVLDTRITTSRIEIDHLELLQRLLLGRTVETSISNGFIAISFRGDVLGCGSVKDGKLRALIPTQEKREILNSL